VEALVDSGYGIGDWQGSGITSSIAASFAAAGTHALGVTTGGESGLSASGFLNQTAAATDVIVKFTYNGDANLDGAVNFDDFNKFLAGYANPETNPARWFTGDFNYDGAVNFDDFNKFLAGLNYFNANGQVVLAGADVWTMQSFAAEDGSPVGDSAPAPEPCGAIAGAAAAMLLARRTRRRPCRSVR
jgi:hypothetical protein